MPSQTSNTWGSESTAVQSRSSLPYQVKEALPQDNKDSSGFCLRTPWLRAVTSILKSFRPSLRWKSVEDLENQNQRCEDPDKSTGTGDNEQTASSTHGPMDDGVSDTKVRHLEYCPAGYPRLAAFNASEHNFMLYRGFSYVHARLLLDLQGEIADLESQLDELDNFHQEEQKFDLLKSRHKDIMNAQDAEKDQASEPVEDRVGTRRTILNKLQEKVSKYDDLLIKSRELTAFQRPNNRDYRSVRNWFHNVRPLVESEEEYIKWREDIVTLRHGREWAGFDGMIETTLHRLDCPLVRKLFCTPDLRRKTTDKNLHYFSPSRVEKLVDLIITCIIFTLLVIPVVAMYRLTSFGTAHSVFSAIGVLVIFTLLFAAAMSLLTKAKRHELFAASAAYCAVLVVFIENLH